MRNFAVIVLVLSSLVLASAAARPETGKLTFNGRQRTYYIFIPEKLTAPAPLLLLLHGSGRDGMSQIKEWKDLANKEGVILAAPDSANSREWAMNTDGPEFLHEVIGAVSAKAPVDVTRIYLFGHSAGGSFALCMAVMESRYFAAAGVHAGALHESFYSYLGLAQRKIPITIWVGTLDPFFDLRTVRATQTELNKHELDTKLVEIPGHDHDYYAIARELNPKIWDVMRGHRLEEEPSWQEYQVP